MYYPGSRNPRIWLPKEADLVASLLEDESAYPTLSLLARHQGKAVGHILFIQAIFNGANEGR